MTRKLLLVLLVAATVPLLVAGSAPAHSPKNPVCKQIQGGITACGYAEVVGCGAGAGEGEATAPVNWHLHVDTNHGDADAYWYGHVAALAATGPCWTDTCTQATLYANGEVIHGSMTYCLG